MGNGNTVGSGADIDIEGHTTTDDGTICVWWCFTWPERVYGETHWRSSPSVATELRVTVRGHRSFASGHETEVDVLSDSVPADVHAKLVEYAIEEDDRQWRMAVAS